MTSNSRVTPSPSSGLCALFVAWSILMPCCVAAQTDSSVTVQLDPLSASVQHPQLTLRAQASASLTQDTVTLTLAKDVQGKNAQAVNQLLARAIDWAREQAPASDTLRVSTHAFRVMPVFTRDGKMNGWQGHAEFVVESRDIIAASALATRLSEQLVLANVACSLSSQARHAEEARLLTEVAQAFRDRAQLATTAFGFKQYVIQKIDLGGSGAAPVASGMMLRAAPMQADGAQPVDVPMVPDSVSVTVSVSGTVGLR